MMYLHDVWVNWFEGEENSYNVCAFHEWRKQDGIEILDQVPIVYTDATLYEQIENDLVDVPTDLLEYIHNRAYLRKNQERIPLEYASIITDGKSVLAFDTMGYGIPVRKSRLIPRQERLVFEMLEDTSKKQFSIQGNPIEKPYHILSLPPEAMVGLTRRERKLKQLLMMALDQLEQTNNKKEIHYWLTEWMPNNYQAIKQMDCYTAWNELYQELYQGWSAAHEDFCKKIIKGQSYFEKMWELENDEQKLQTYKRII
ncbi:UPF0736 protein [Paraliobacillus quinghaiensis]|uniref:UPF0736 protein n=1 Tax=Paraliobacillus quinghaiensis TaxID=470815 RepID=A0A917TL95_9BACI|nr:DUF3603 family protein [Paraliobacillus quinghaiensis]GGM24964.1 UPF0736 protein [Paraliobacillus quinghaiensis]